MANARAQLVCVPVQEGKFGGTRGGSAWAEFVGFSNNLFLGAIEYMDIGDEARELAYESGLLDL